MDTLVIGAGLAGTAVARSLAERGQKVIIIDRHEQAARETSGNPAGIFMPVLEAASSPRELFYLDALKLLLNRLETAGTAIEHELCGVLHLPRDEKIAQRFQRIRERSDLPANTARFLDATAASELSGLEITRDCLYYPHGGWLSPASLCRHNIDHPNISFIAGQAVDTLRRNATQWQAHSAQGEVVAEADSAVIASGHLASRFEQTARLPLNQVAGQITCLQSERPLSLKQVICHKGYALPMSDKELLIGATYNRDRSDRAPSPHEHEENLETLRRFLPGLGMRFTAKDVTGGRVGFRCVVPGRMPVAGLLRSDSNGALAVSTAHASRGILSSGLCAEILADRLCGIDSPFEHHTRTISPHRFSR